ncbi:MAG: cyclic peptide export ABC transporter [Xenococcaceae cyanobacterium]
MTLIYTLFKFAKKTFFLAIFVAIISSICNTGLIVLISEIINTPSTQNFKLLLPFSGLLVLLFISYYWSQNMLAELSEKAVFQMRILLSKQILASSLSHLEKLGPDKLLASLTSDINAISNGFINVPYFCLNLAVLVTLFVYLASLALMPFMIFLLLSLATILTLQFLLKQAEERFSRSRETENHLFAHFRTIIQGFKELKLHHQRQQDFFEQDLQATANTYRRYNILGYQAVAVATTFGLTIIFLVLGLILFVFPRIFEIEPSILSTYALVAFYSTMPASSILNSLPIFSRANIALEKIKSLGLSLDKEGREIENRDLLKIQNQWQKLELAVVTHTYYRELEESHFTLGPINLTLYPGELVFIVGGNGSGKSTLAKIITGLYSPEEGKIKFADQTVDDYNREWYRQHFSAIFADYYLFERLLGLDEQNLDSNAQAYLQELELEKKVQIKEDKLSTIALSQGQKKRLALLNAYLEDRPIYLFDEWASDQDPIFKRVFYNRILLDLKRQGKTIVVISHDDRYFHLADRIFRLDYGKLSATQGELLLHVGNLMSVISETDESDIKEKIQNLSLQEFSYFLEELNKEFEQIFTTIHLLNDRSLNDKIEIIIETISLKIALILQAEQVTFFVVDKENGRLWSKNARGPGGELINIEIPLNAGIAGYVATMGETVNIPDPYKDPRFNPQVDRNTGFRTRNILCLPIFNSQNEVFAVVQVLNKTGDKPFDSEEEQKFLELTQSLGMILETSILSIQKGRSIINQ